MGLDQRNTLRNLSQYKREFTVKTNIDEQYVPVDLASIFSNWRPYDSFIRSEAKKHKHVVFFGCGAIFSSIVDTWYARVGVEITFCCDNNPAKWENSYCGIECIRYEKLLEIKKDVVIFITVGNFIPVYEQLLQDGFTDLHILYKYDLDAAQLIKSSNVHQLIRDAEAGRGLLGDEKSQKIFDAIICRASGANIDIMSMLNIFEGNQYFPSDLINLSSHESYVDVGAYDGDTIRQFLRNCNNKFNKIYGFELDKNNFAKLESNLSSLPNTADIEIYNIGAWNKRESISYSSGLTQSTIGAGEEIALAAPLDEIIHNKEITYIKMDIEGAEIAALMGASKIIADKKPKLAICVYHKISHLWEIPNLIHQLLPDHNIFLRHHTRLEYETVCYAVPKTPVLN